MNRFTLENYFQLHDGKAIDFRIRANKVNELETVNTSQRDQLFKRVEELEQFQREYETAQEYERDRS